MIEIERKFLVKDTSYRETASSRIEMVQGFLNTDPVKTVRVRRMGKEAWITVKGKTRKGGTTRHEWEYPIPVREAEELLRLCTPGVIRKMRYHVPVGSHLFEVDEFLDENEGLVLAEVELKDAAEAFEKPSWLGREVTGQPAYYNSQLSLNPFKSWKP
jgi:CYTH domain-containing protein